ncbi:MAG: hypothetical protein V7642_1863 [Burkholderiales bacterium]|jgi:hypothetical protein
MTIGGTGEESTRYSAVTLLTSEHGPDEQYRQGPSFETDFQFLLPCVVILTTSSSAPRPTRPDAPDSPASD